MTTVGKLVQLASRVDRLGVTVTRLGLIVVLLWIGGQKITRFEADGIVPVVANSPFMSFFYKAPAGEYRQHMNREGAVAPANRAWHEANHTYTFAYGLGAVIVAYGLMIASHPWLPRLAALGSFLVLVMSFVTLSFLISTPECWVPNLGGPEHGFPMLAAPGRLVLKDAIMMGAALVTMADSARAYLASKTAAKATANRVATPDRPEAQFVWNGAMI
jgi:uncharacterized membrane protein YkgB